METLRGKEGFPFLEAAKINWKHNSLRPTAVSAAFLVLVPFLVGTANLDSYASAVPLERFVALIGIVMLTPLFEPEQNAGIDDLVSSKYISPVRIYRIRAVYSLFLLSAFIGSFAVYMRLRACDVTLLLALGTLAGAVFLGALGMFAASLCGSTVAAYMVPAVFYALNYGLGGKLGNFYLFSMAAGQFVPKIWLFGTGLALIEAAVRLKGVIARRRR